MEGIPRLFLSSPQVLAHGILSRNLCLELACSGTVDLNRRENGSVSLAVTLRSVVVTMCP